MTDSYVPSQAILRKYAEVLVNFALNSGEGVKPGEVVQCVVPDVAKPLALQLQNAILRAGGYPVMRLLPTGFDKDFFTLANEKQLKFFPKKFLKARVELLDHNIGIIADPNPQELAEIDPQKFIMARDSAKEYRDWVTDKETQGKYTWTAGLWGVEAKAKLVGLSLEEYWQQIIKACFLDHENPVSEWKKLNKAQQEIKAELNKRSIEYLEIKGPDVDLHVQLGPDRIWNAGTGRNVPSFEFFTSPNWRGTEGWIKFNQPVYRYGQVLNGISLEFKNGIVVKAHAEVGNKFLQEMLKSPNANKIGEYSLTDKRMSRITHVMAETLYDENIGGKFGNTHLAVGMSYKDCYRNQDECAKLTKLDWEEKGFNDSSEHTDIISTTDRTVTATLTSGEKEVLYKDGQFTFYKGKLF
jgi:aminopeptidase